MTGRKNSSGDSRREIRAHLVGRLRARAPELERAVLSRIQSVDQSTGNSDPAYAAGLRRAVSGALSYGLETIEKGDESTVPIPPETTRQARRAAREGVRLDTVMRRYAAGNKSLEEFVVAEADDLPSWMLCQILSNQGPHVDRLMDSVAVAYRDEVEQTERSSAQMQADHIVRFLESDSLLGPADIDYDFNLWHLGLIISGSRGEMAARTLVAKLDCTSISVVRDHDTVWAWLGTRDDLGLSSLERALSDVPGEARIAMGEPRKGPAGWRQTFREAQAAFEVSLIRTQHITRCRDVILESAVLRDPPLATALIETYLSPLDAGRRDTGRNLRRTLRAYFAANENAASTASALGINRHTVKRHLRRVEERLGQTVASCAAQLRVALSAEDLLSAAG